MQGPLYQFSDLFPAIQKKLGNRTDFGTAGAGGDWTRWLKDSLLELTQNYQFEELMVNGAFVGLTPGLAEYPLPAFTTAPDSLFKDARSFYLSLDTTGANQGSGYQLKGRSITFVEQYAQLPGIPLYWAQSGNQVVFGFNPSASYFVKMRYQRQHPYTIPNGVVADTILLPYDWNEIVEYMAALRGASEKRAWDYVKAYTALLHGDAEFQQSQGKEGKPGLIFGRTSQQTRNKGHNERSFNVMTAQRY